MIHPTDDELLDLALAEDDRDVEVEAHLRACRECASRYEKVMGEQAMLRRAFASVEAPPDLERTILPRRRWRVWPIAAGFLVCLGVGALAYRAASWRRDAMRLSEETTALRARVRELETRPASSSFERIQADLRTVAHKIEAGREAVTHGSDEAASQFAELYDQGEVLYSDLIADRIGQVAPLTAEQRGRLREIVDRLYDGTDLRKRAAEVTAALRKILSAEQYAAFEEFVREEAASEREYALDALVQELAQEFDLRFSEGESLRAVLEAKYPQAELPGMAFFQDPSDALLDDASLAAEVRGAMVPAYYARFDAWLKDLAKSRAEVDEALRKHHPEK